MKITTTQEKAFERAKMYNDRGIAISFSFLPVRKWKRENIQIDVDEYLALTDEIQKSGANADMTIKLMQFGVSTSYEFAKETLVPVFQKAKENNTRIWLDQGLGRYVDDVLRLGGEQSKDSVGICIQACRSRSSADIDTVSGYPIRLVKGFYNDYDIRPWREVTKNYRKLMDEVAEKSSYPCFATHDLTLIKHARELLREREGEIQFFAGLRDELARELVADGYRVRIYLPYGDVIRFIAKGISEFDMPRALQRLLHFKTIR